MHGQGAVFEYHSWLARYQSCLAGLTTSYYHLGDVGSPPAAKSGRREISEILWKATLNPKSYIMQTYIMLSYLIGLTVE